MSEFRADLHIHSRFSRATSRALNLPLLAGWAALKGLNVLGTGDFTHPEWRAEMAEQLELDEKSALYRLKNPALVAQNLPEWAGSPLLAERAAQVRFLLQAEISSIYKRGDRTRKVHNLVYMPSLEAADKFSERLAEVGNIKSDGRPILGLDSEHLLEMVLGFADSYLIPAHIWTPWFSLFGSKSGFDRLEDCFGSLSPHIFALETGLSSDPEMNRRISALDGYKLISNSDAHSGENLAREANIFSGEISYSGIFGALKAPNAQDAALPTRFLGTYEFFPDEGKYHLDGHRACNVALSPEETRELGGRCPVCGKPLTVGVLYRVRELADRVEPLYRPDESFKSLIPLPEVIGEVLGVGPKSRKVGDMYQKLLADLGPELDILLNVPTEAIARHSAPLAEGISRMRQGKVLRQGGYDGEYGVISVFSPEEQRELKARGGVSRGKSGSALLPGLTQTEKAPRKRAKKSEADAPSVGKHPVDEHRADKQPAGEHPASERPEDAADQQPALAPTECSAAPEAAPRLNSRQQQAAQADGPLLTIAGPGTGKTHTLVERIRRLLAEGVPPRRILALTFTRRAANELDERLNAALAAMPAAHIAHSDDGKPQLPRTDTLHALAFEFWHRVQGQSPVLMDEDSAFRVFSEASADESAANRKLVWNAINLAREKRSPMPPELQGYFDRYSMHKDTWNLADYTDLLEFWLTHARTGQYPPVWQHILVDEIQDLSPLQLELIEAISPKGGEGFFGIGDPNQSIYGFRGAHGNVEEFFKNIWPHTLTVHLQENYRSGAPVIELAQSVFADLPGVEELKPMSRKPAEMHYFEANSAESEATWLAGQIRQLLGATSHSLLDSAAHSEAEPYSPGDIAILMRGRMLMQPIRRALERSGLPFSQPSADPFWHEPRVIKILQVVGRMLGISVPLPEPGREHRPSTPECPDRVLARGPSSMAIFWGNSEPFDSRFWQSREFKELSAAFDTHQGWHGLFNWLGLQNELELVRQKSEKIQLITMHASKGLEFRAVFLPGLEEGIMPFAGKEFLNGQPPGALDLDEEKRLLYVAMTRAKEGLYLSRAEKRYVYARELRLPASRFLRKLPMHMLKHSRMVAKTSTHEEQLKLI